MAGEYGWGGLGGGLGGPGFPDILTALGTALLSSPRDAPFANLPQTLQTATQAGQQRQSNAAMALALTKAGVDPETAATLSMNPTAASLMVAQQNQQRILDQNKAYFGAGAGNLGLGVPAAPTAPVAPATPSAPTASGPALDQYAGAIKGNESGGNYQALGPVTRTGDRAYGAYQVMGANVGPWTKEILGREMTPQEFLADQKAQDQVFQGKFGQYVQKTGNPQDAASMWFTGRPLAQARGARDQLGTRVEDYVARFNRMAGGGAPQVAAGAEAAPPAIASAPLPDQPVRVAAAGGKVPVPVPASLPPPAAPPAGGAPTGNSTRDWAMQRLNADLYQMANAKAVGNDALVEVIKARMPTYTKWLEPTETARALAEAGITGADAQAIQQQNITRPERQFQRQGEQFEAQQRQALRLGTMTPEEKYEISAGRSPTGLSTGTRLAAEAKGAETLATTEAAARGAFSKEATAGAQVAQNLQRAVGRANIHLNNVIEMGGYGWLESNPVARTLAHATPDIPRVTNWHATEVERQHFDNAMATVGAAVAAAKNKAEGGGNMSAIEQTLARQDLAILTSADPSVAKGAMKQLQSQIDDALELDREHGLYGGKQVLRGASRLNRAVSGSMGNIVQTPHGTLREIP